MNLSEISIYPIKSLGGIRVSSAAIGRHGLENDRRWLLVDANGRFLTQRELPGMATLAVTLSENSVHVSKPDGETFAISLSGEIFDARVSARVWNSVSEVYDCGAEAAEWFSEVLGREVKLLYMPDDAGRQINERFAEPGEMVSFADGYPLMLIGDASLTELNSRLSSPVPMDRFRPNLVVSGGEPFAEDGWRRIRVGEAVFRVVKPCERCVMTTIDQRSGEFAGGEPLRTLATYRMAHKVLPDSYADFGMGPTVVLFGQNLIPDTPGVTVRVGDEVEVL